MRRFLGRIFTNSKAHLLGVAEVLDFPEELRRLMRKASDEECEAIVLSHAEGRYGGPVDWRGTPNDVYEILGPCLTETERALLPPVSSLPEQEPAKIVATLDSHLLDGPRALRALESFGDFIIVLLVPRARLSQFDQLARHWLA